MIIVDDSRGISCNFSFLALIDKDYIYPGIFPLKSETHGGDDVGVFALGNLDLSFPRRH